MAQNRKNLLIKYLVCLCVGIAMVFVVFLIQGLFNGQHKSAKEVLYILQNAFCTPGLLMILFSGLMFVSDEGGFIGIGYALGRAARVFIPFVAKDVETYAEYRERKTGKKTASGTKLSVFLTGLFFFLVSMIFLIIWFQL